VGERLPGGTYSAALSRASSVLTGISPPLVDAVLQFKGPAAVVSALTAEEATLLASKGNDPIYDDLVFGNMNVALSLVRKRPGEFAGIRSRMEGILQDAGQAPQVAKIETFLSILTRDVEASAKTVVSTNTSATAYKENTFPLYMFWHMILKKVIVGQDSYEEIEQKTLFDSTTNKVYVPFEKMPKCKTPAHLFLAFAMFKEAITVLRRTALRAWSGLEAQLYRTEATMGFAVAQQFVGEVLRRLDLHDFENIVCLLASGDSFEGKTRTRGSSELAIPKNRTP
jgi:hypothetical protein